MGDRKTRSFDVTDRKSPLSRMIKKVQDEWSFAEIALFTKLHRLICLDASVAKGWINPDVPATKAAVDNMIRELDPKYADELKVFAEAKKAKVEAEAKKAKVEAEAKKSD